MNSLFSCIQWHDIDDNNEEIQTYDFMSNISVSKLHEDFIESGGMLQLTVEEVEALILDFHSTKNLAASLSISAKCGDYRPATASLFDLCRLSITNFDAIGTEGKCVLLLQLLRIHRDVPEIVLLSLGCIFCLVQSEMNVFRFLDDKICEDLVWILNNYKWAYVGSVSVDKQPNSKSENELFLRKRNLQLRVVGWCVRLVWLIVENEVEGRNAFEATSIGDDIYAFLYQLMECLKQGDDSQLVPCDGAMGHHYDLFTLFLSSRPTNATSNSPATSSIPDYCTSLADSLRRPVNYFVVACCGAICHLCRENIATSEHLSSLGLKGLLETASLATRHTMYPGATEESLNALLMAKKVLLWMTDDGNGIGQYVMSRRMPDESSLFRRPAKYQLSKEILVQVLWDVLTYVVVSSGRPSSAGPPRTPARSSPSAVPTSACSPRGLARKKEDIVSVFSELTSDLSKRTMVLANTIVSQREEEWRLDLESQLLHTTVEDSMRKIAESRRVYAAEKARLDELARTLQEEETKRRELEESIRKLETSNSEVLSEIHTLESKSASASAEHESVMIRLRETVSSTEKALQDLTTEEVEQARALSEVMSARALAELRLAEVENRTVHETESLLTIAEGGVSHISEGVGRGLGWVDLFGGQGISADVEGGGVMRQFKTLFNQRANQGSSTQQIASTKTSSSHPPSVRSAKVDNSTGQRYQNEYKQRGWEAEQPEGDLHNLLERLPPPPSAGYSPDVRLRSSKSGSTAYKQTTETLSPVANSVLYGNTDGDKSKQKNGGIIRASPQDGTWESESTVLSHADGLESSRYYSPLKSPKSRGLPDDDAIMRITTLYTKKKGVSPLPNGGVSI